MWEPRSAARRSVWRRLLQLVVCPLLFDGKTACPSRPQGFSGSVERLSSAVKTILSQVEVEIVKRSDLVKGFVVLPKRWVVGRTLAWLNRCRRLAKNWENLNRKGIPPRTAAFPAFGSRVSLWGV